MRKSAAKSNRVARRAAKRAHKASLELALAHLALPKNASVAPSVNRNKWSAAMGSGWTQNWVVSLALAFISPIVGILMKTPTNNRRWFSDWVDDSDMDWRNRYHQNPASSDRSSASHCWNQLLSRTTGRIFPLWVCGHFTVARQVDIFAASKRKSGVESGLEQGYSHL